MAIARVRVCVRARVGVLAMVPNYSDINQRFSEKNLFLFHQSHIYEMTAEYITLLRKVKNKKR